MNINPKAKRILCYGDSITNGHDPEAEPRFDCNKRWTGVLQTLLGNNYEIVEEGLGGRTTNLDDPKSPYKNGLSFFPVCLTSHLPLDIIIILLGTNNLKGRFAQTPTQIAKSLVEYIKLTKELCTEDGYKLPKIILASPPSIIEEYVPKDWDFSGAEAKARNLSTEYNIVAKENNVDYIDLSEIQPSKNDGVHLNEEGNKLLAEKIYKHICRY